MEKQIELDGTLIKVSDKAIEVNGKRVITQGKIEIVGHNDHSAMHETYIDKRQLEEAA